MEGCSHEGIRRQIERFIDQIRVLDWSPKSVSSYRTHLGAFTRYIERETTVEDLQSVTSEVLFQYQMYLYSWCNEKGKGLSIGTQSGRLTAVRALFRQFARAGILRFDPSSSMVLPKRKHSLPRTVLTKREVLRLLAAPDTTTPLGLRDRAMLEVLYSTGVRNAELRGLKLYDVEFQRSQIRINGGKNGKDRVVPLGRPARDCLRRYLEEARPRLQAAPGSESPSLATVFLSKTGRALRSLAVIYAVRKHARRARIRKPITPHTLRHTFATHMLAGKADLRHIQVMLGHSSLASTQIYTRVEITDLKAVHRRCHPREQRP